MMRMMTVLGIVLLSVLTAVGCGRKPNIEVESKKTLDGIQTEVKDMEIKDVKRFALAYSEEIQKAKDRMKKLQSDLKALSPDELRGEKASEIRSEFAKATLKTTQLTKRFDVYAEKYLKEGGSLSEIAAA